MSPGNAEDGLTSVDNSSEESAETLPADPENDEQADFRDPEEDPSKAQSPQNAVPSVNIADLSSFGNASHISADDAYLTSLFSGAAVYTYPIKTPDGIAGLNPRLSLIYNSQSAGGTYGWLGDGWSLNDFYIQRDVYFTPADTSDDKFRLMFNGESHDLVYDAADQRYHTETETHLCIKKLTGGSNQYNDYWTVKEKDGTEYRFGYTADAELPNSVEGRNYTVKWKLDRIQDTSGNTVFYNYVKNPSDGEVGTSYLQNITYNNGLTIIEFNRVSKPVTFSGYRDGTLVTEKSLLSDITIKQQNIISARYDILYNTSENHVFLESIQHSGAGTDVLPKTEFSYGSTEGNFVDGSTGVLPAIMYGISSSKGHVIIDIDRDGLPDMIRGHKPSGELIEEVYINNGSHMCENDSWNVPEDLRNASTRLTDINGDGFIDIIHSSIQSSVLTQSAWINNGSAFVSNTNWIPPTSFYLYNGDLGVKIMDINGDGLPDFVQSYRNYNNVWINTGSGFVLDPHWTIPVYFYDNEDKCYRITDINGDGLPDIVLSRQYCSIPKKEVWLNTGSSFVLDDNWVIPVIFNDFNDYGARLSDINCDGLPDILVSWRHYSNSSNQVWINNGSGFVRNYNLTIPTTFCHEAWYDDVTITDINYDGSPDFVLLYWDRPSVWVSTLNVDTHLLNRINHSSGMVTKIDYDVASNYNNTAENGSKSMSSAIKIVKRVTIENGLTDDQKTTSTLTYDYEGGLMHIEPRGESEFRGFRKVSVDDGRSVTEHYFHQDKIKKGKEYRTIVKSISGDIYSLVENTYRLVIHDNYYTVLLTNVSQSLYDGETTPVTMNTDYIYTIYGNIAEISEEGDISKTGDERKTSISHQMNLSGWVSRPIRKTIKDSSSQNVSVTKYCYDGNTYGIPPSKGKLTKVIYWNDNGADVIHTFAYAENGNLLTQTDGNNHTTTLTYELNNVYPASVTNALNQTTTLDYNFTIGKLMNVTDPNGFKTSAEYDTLGRIKKVIKPGDSSAYSTIRYAYSEIGEFPRYVRTGCKTNGSSYYYTNTYYDGLDRVVKITRPDSFNNTIIEEQYYNDFGDLSATTAPRLTPEAKLNTTYAYDAFGRVTRVTAPDGAFKEYSYNRLKTQLTDENGGIWFYYKDVYGNIVQITEHNIDSNGLSQYNTFYEYNALNLVTKIHPENTFNQTRIRFDIKVPNGSGTPTATYKYVSLSDLGGGTALNATYKSANTTFTYDSLGRRIGVNDPDLGEWTYTYNANGKVAAETDARGVTTTYVYDALDRLTKIDYPTDPDITFIYDTGTVGTLYRVTSEIANKTCAYDSRLRVTNETMRIGTTNYSTHYVYDAMDRITQTTYPNGKVAAYAYDNQTLLKSVPGVVSNISYNSKGLMTQKNFSNGVNTTLAYNDTTARLSGIVTPGLQNLSYTFDAKGNVISIADHVLNDYQHFHYDSLDRLIAACGQNYSQSFAYNPLGCVLAVLDMDYVTNTEKIAGFEYGNNAGIHAPTRVYNVNMTYDANGNLLSDGNFTYQYNNANQLKKVIKKSNNQTVAEFVYDESGNRVQKTENGVTTLYINNQYEIENGNATIYYFVNGDRVAKESSEGVFWYLTDHLGSTNVMTDSSGSLVERTSYYPFGAYRSGEASEKYAFTGKEFDSDIGLYYYGARYYNPETFVFTQADSMIPDVYNPQALNRYAYCLNNPVKYEDPDGHVPFLVVTAVAGVGVGIVAGAGIEAYHQLRTTGQISDTRAVLKAAAVGGVAGGVAGLTLGVGTSLIATGSVFSSASAVAAGMSSMVGSGVTAEGAIVYGHLGAYSNMAAGATERLIDDAGERNKMASVFDGNAILKDYAYGTAAGVSGMAGNYVKVNSEFFSQVPSESLSKATMIAAEAGTGAALNAAADTADRHSYHYKYNVGPFVFKVPKNSEVGKAIAACRKRSER